LGLKEELIGGKILIGGTYFFPFFLEGENLKGYFNITIGFL